MDSDNEQCRDEGDVQDEQNWLEVGWSEDRDISLSSVDHSHRQNKSSDTQQLKSKEVANHSNAMPVPSHTDKNDSIMARMALNTHKAGMEGLDKEKINKVIYEASKGSKFYENEQKKDKQVNKRIEQMKEELEKISEQQKRKAQIEVDKLVEELKKQRDFSRTIVHIDMDMFYAAVEMKDNPSLRDRPMAVGGTGMLSTSNYKARRYGVRAAMPGFIGKKLCPELVIVPPNFDKYRAVSKEVREILSEYDPNFVPMSLDEAYLDMTEHLEKRREFSEEKRMFPYRMMNESVQGSTGKVKGDVNNASVTRNGVSSVSTGSTNVCVNSASTTGLSTGSKNVGVPETIASSIGTGSTNVCVNGASTKSHSTESTKPDERDTCFTSLGTGSTNVCVNGASTTGNSVDNSSGRQLKRSLFRQSAECVGQSDQNDSQLDEDHYSQNCEVFGFTAEEAVREMRFRIEQKTQLTASAGIACNTMLSKICSDKNKPNGQYRIEPTLEAVTQFIKDLPIRKVSGIGKVTEKLLNALGVNTCTDLYNNRAVLYLLFSKTSSNHFLRISLGMGSNRIERDGERKSMSTERTFREISDPAELTEKCFELSKALSEDLQSENLKGKTVTLKIKLVTFEVKTRAITLPYATNTAKDINVSAQDLLKTEIQAMQPEPLRLRLMGVRMSSFSSQGVATGKQGSIIGFLHKPSTVSKKTEKLNFSDISETYPVSMNSQQIISEPQNFANSINSQDTGTCVQTQSSFAFSSQNTDMTGDIGGAEPSEMLNMESMKFYREGKSRENYKNQELQRNEHFMEIFQRQDNTGQARTQKPGKTKGNQQLYISKETECKDSVSLLSKLTPKTPTSTRTRKLPADSVNLINNGLPASSVTSFNDNGLPAGSVTSFNDNGLPAGSVTSFNDSEACVFTCPICSHQQQGNLADFNSHVDMCLNTRAIQDILANSDNSERNATANSSTNKRSLTTSQHSSSKKRRKMVSTAKKSNSTLDRFFISPN